MKKAVTSTIAKPTVRRVASSTRAMHKVPTSRSPSSLEPSRSWKASMSHMVQTWTKITASTSARSMPKPSFFIGVSIGSKCEVRNSGLISRASTIITVRCVVRNDRPSGVPNSAT